MLILRFIILYFVLRAGFAVAEMPQTIPDREALSDWVVDLGKETIDGQLLGLKTFWYNGDDPIHHVAHKDFESRFVRGTSAVINHGYTSANYWYRISFHNPFDQVETIFLHDPHSVYDEFEVYRGTNRVGELHYSDPIHKRIVAIELPANSTQVVHIRKKTNAVAQQSTFTFWKHEGVLRRAIQNSELRFQAVTTSLLMGAFLTLSLLFAYRKKIYFYYLGYLLSFVMFGTWVWSVYDLPFYARWGGSLSLFCVLFTALFVDEFLEIKRHSPRMHRLFQVYAALSFLSIGFEWVNPILRAYAGSILSIIIQASTVWLGAMLFYRYRQAYILIFNVAFGSFLISGFIQLMIWMGRIDSGENLIMFYGVATENVLMVLAIGYRIVVTEASHKQTDNLLVHSFEQLSKVFYPHQILQIRDGRTVEETMPVGEKDACILYFQIVGGEALMNESYEDCVENFMVRCRQILMERYDPIRFSCDAHIIREMGDGFLCSIGYPFHQIGRLKSDSAVELAEKLIQEFDSLVKALDAPQKIHCSIGIVHGLVKSYFSRSGRIRDDLWGRAIALASSYGSASEQLFASLGREPENVIILHDAVFESLSRKNRQGYQVLEFPLAQGILGKDLEGDCLAYRIHEQNASAPSIRKAS